MQSHLVTTQPKFNLLHSGSAERDKKSLCDLLDEIGAAHSVTPFEVDEGAVERVLVEMLDLPWAPGIKNASPFKKVASFVSCFVARKPIITTLPVSKFGPLADHQNAIAAHQIAVIALHGAVIECPFRGPFPLANPITVSRHYWKELIATLNNSGPAYFHYISLLYEALAYEANPKASYKTLMRVATPESVV